MKAMITILIQITRLNISSYEQFLQLSGWNPDVQLETASALPLFFLPFSFTV